MSNILTTYSGKDANLSFVHPLAGPIQAAGIAEVGLDGLRINMTVDQAVLQVGMDGAVQPSVVPGDMAEVEIDVWQTSTLHQQLLAVYNACKAARDEGNVQPWFAGQLLIQNIVDGTKHIGTGVGFKKVPTKAYAAQASRITWVLVCCNMSNE